MPAPLSQRSIGDQGLCGCLRPSRPAKWQAREGPPRFLQSPRCPFQPRLACCRGSREDAVASPLSSLLDTARQFSRRGRRRNKRAWPAVHIALQGRSLKPADAKFSGATRPTGVNFKFFSWLFADNLGRLFVAAQPKEGGMPHLALTRPLGEFYLARIGSQDFGQNSLNRPVVSDNG